MYVFVFVCAGLNNLLAAYSDKSAYAQCTFAFCQGKGHPVMLFKGITTVRRARLYNKSRPYCSPSLPHPLSLSLSLCPSPTNQGTIVAARGPPDFGWDPIFQPDGFQQTYAEMESSVKNSISHRYKAVHALGDYLISQRGGGKGEGVEGGGEGVGVEGEGEGVEREGEVPETKRVKTDK